MAADLLSLGPRLCQFFYDLGLIQFVWTLCVKIGHCSSERSTSLTVPTKRINFDGKLAAGIEVCRHMASLDLVPVISADCPSRATRCQSMTSRACRLDYFGRCAMHGSVRYVLFEYSSRASMSRKVEHQMCRVGNRNKPRSHHVA